MIRQTWRTLRSRQDSRKCRIQCGIEQAADLVGLLPETFRGHKYLITCTWTNASTPTTQLSTDHRTSSGSSFLTSVAQGKMPCSVKHLSLLLLKNLSKSISLGLLFIDRWLCAGVRLLRKTRPHRWKPSWANTTSPSYGQETCSWTASSANPAGRSWLWAICPWLRLWPCELETIPRWKFPIASGNTGAMLYRLGYQTTH